MAGPTIARPVWATSKRLRPGSRRQRRPLGRHAHGRACRLTGRSPDSRLPSRANQLSWHLAIGLGAAAGTLPIRCAGSVGMMARSRGRGVGPRPRLRRRCRSPGGHAHRWARCQWTSACCATVGTAVSGSGVCCRSAGRGRLVRAGRRDGRRGECGDSSRSAGMLPNGGPVRLCGRGDGGLGRRGLGAGSRPRLGGGVGRLVVAPTPNRRQGHRTLPLPRRVTYLGLGHWSRRGRSSNPGSGAACGGRRRSAVRATVTSVVALVIWLLRPQPGSVSRTLADPASHVIRPAYGIGAVVGHVAWDRWVGSGAFVGVERFGYIANGKIAMWCSSLSAKLRSVFVVASNGPAERQGLWCRADGGRGWGSGAVVGVAALDGRDGQVFHGTSKLCFGGLHDRVYFYPATGEVAVNTLPSRSEQLTDDVKIRSLIDLAYARIPPLGFIFASFPA